MRDILKMIRFDYLCVRQIALLLMLTLYAMLLIAASAFSPMSVVFSSIGVFLLMSALHNAEDRSAMNRLYGTLPVRLKSIVRARFCFLILLCLITEAVQIISALIACRLQLYRCFLNPQSENYQLIASTFNNSDGFAVFLPVMLFCGCGFILGLLEMTGLLFGRENQIKSVLILLGIAGTLLFAFFALDMHGAIPEEIDLEVFMAHISEKRVRFALCGNIVTILFCLLFGEITAKALEKKEL